MDYLSWGGGPKTVLFIQGGPGSLVPTGMLRRMFRRQFDAFLDAGYAVWIVTRRRGMPPEHSIVDMADDYAGLIAGEFGGRVDVVVAESFGGMIAQYLAARHPDSFGHIAMVVTAAELSDWGKDVDARMAQALAGGDTNGAGTVFAEYLLPGRRLIWLRRLIGPLISRRLMSGSDFPTQDVLTEVKGELTFNSRAVLPLIRRPVLLICGGSDQFFPREVAQETAGLIPDCTLVWYEGKGHLGAASSGRIAQDVLEFAGRG
jgi:pimeloyl-ACP methyl ester carboxylesterase